MVRVLIADDHHFVRKGLRRLLDSRQCIEVVGEAKDGEETLQLAGVLKPDVLILDIAMPRMSGIDVLKRLREWVHRPAVIVLSMSNSAELKQEAAWAGADVFLTKGGAVEELLRSIKEVAGESRLSACGET
ncbi:MAG TPA: response regulator transcription factor [Candidatus Sulfomarinibacteraceae bacterium]|nr:response regulator transcription factor [Candidatus Sulfomarinibacteraceae bacterium]